MRRIFSIIFICCVTLLYASGPVYTLNEQWLNAGDGVKLLDPYYGPGVTITWDGPSKGGKAHGTGTAKKYKNGELESTYVGEYKNGVREGKGTETKADGTVFKGTFQGGQMIGQGTMDYENGRHYEGEIINYRAHGQGKGRWGSGSSFEGFWVGGSPYTGQFTSNDGSSIYLQEGEPVERINEKRSNYSPKIGSKQTEYFDENWNRTDAKNASYYRIITYEAPHKPKGVVKDYYMNGKLQGEATYAYMDYDDEGKNFFEGIMKTYYPNGKLKSESIYLNNKPNGPQYTYYDNGNKKSESFFNYGEPEGSMMTYYPNGKVEKIAKIEEGALKNNKYLQFTEDGESAFLVYDEDFRRNESSWTYSGVNGRSYVNSNNTVTFEVTPDRSVSGGIYAGFDNNSNNIVEITTRRNPEEKVVIGFMFGFKDWNNYCGLLIAADRFTYQQVKNGQKVTDYDWQYCESIQPDINEVTIANLGPNLAFEINGQGIGQINRPRYDGGLYVLTVANSGIKEATVDAGDLSLYEFVENESQIADYIPDNVEEGGWRGSGSGFFITEDGILATNYHVVENMNEIEVSFTRNGIKESYPASVVMSDKQNDLSILRIEDPSFKNMDILPYNVFSKIKDTGSEVFTLGYPNPTVLGEEVKYTDGKISAKTGLYGDATVYQISVPIQPGNSGGPLFDLDGNMVGITQGVHISRYYLPQNVNYAVKSTYLKSLIESLPQHIELGSNANLTELSLPEKIKLLEPYMVLIKVK